MENKNDLNYKCKYLNYMILRSWQSRTAPHQTEQTLETYAFVPARPPESLLERPSSSNVAGVKFRWRKMEQVICASLRLPRLSSPAIQIINLLFYFLLFFF